MLFIVALTSSRIGCSEDTVSLGDVGVVEAMHADAGATAPDAGREVVPDAGSSNDASTADATVSRDGGVSDAGPELLPFGAPCTLFEECGRYTREQAGAVRGFATPVMSV